VAGAGLAERGTGLPETTFEVVYDGPALDDGRMPVRDLAPALLALGDLFVDASGVVHPRQPPVALKIKATAEGSFVIDLLLEAPGVWDNFVNLFSSDGASALVNFRDAVLGTAGLFWLVKQVAGRAIKSKEDSPEPGHIRITLNDGTTLDVPADVLLLFESLPVRGKAREVVQPLTRDGIDRVSFRSDREKTVEIEKQDLSAYAIPEVEEVPVLERETEIVVSIVGPVFLDDNKWRLTDGEQTFYAKIDDRQFLNDIDRGVESFRKGDMLQCRVRRVQTRRGDTLHSDYTVIEVQEHIPREEQLQLGEIGSPSEPAEPSEAA
jgi:hypothetical protein